MRGLTNEERAFLLDLSARCGRERTGRSTGYANLSREEVVLASRLHARGCIERTKEEHADLPPGAVALVSRISATGELALRLDTAARGYGS